MSKRLVAIDFDGTWAEAPKFFADFGEALRDAGWTVVILTANPDTENELKKSAKDSYDSIVVADHDSIDEHVTATSKADWLDKNKADLLIDNNVTNCIAATEYTDACLFFAKRDPDVKAKKAKQTQKNSTPTTYIGYSVGMVTQHPAAVPPPSAA